MKLTITIEGRSHRQVLNALDDLPLHDVRGQLVKHKNTNKKGETTVYAKRGGISIAWDGRREHDDRDSCRTYGNSVRSPTVEIGP